MPRGDGENRTPGGSQARGPSCAGLSHVRNPAHTAPAVTSSPAIMGLRSAAARFTVSGQRQPGLSEPSRWWGQDSNLRRLSQRVYSPSPLTAREPHQGRPECSGEAPTGSKSARGCAPAGRRRLKVGAPSPIACDAACCRPPMPAPTSTATSPPRARVRRALARLLAGRAYACDAALEAERGLRRAIAALVAAPDRDAVLEAGLAGVADLLGPR